MHYEGYNLMLQTLEIGHKTFLIMTGSTLDNISHNEYYLLYIIERRGGGRGGGGGGEEESERDLNWNFQ